MLKVRGEEMKTKIINGWEYTCEDEQKGKSYNKIDMPHGWSLWTAEDCINLHNNKKSRKSLSLETCWFWIEQPFLLNSRNKLVARFDADAGWAGLGCGGDRLISVAAIGVRFKRKVKA